MTALARDCPDYGTCRIRVNPVSFRGAREPPQRAHIFPVSKMRLKANKLHDVLALSMCSTAGDYVPQTPYWACLWIIMDYMTPLIFDPRYKYLAILLHSGITQLV